MKKEMICRKVESADESFEIRVSFTESVTGYENLRFGLEASAWFPRSWGVLVWRVLHVLLIVAAPPLVAVTAVAMLLLLALLDILTVPIWLLIGFGLIGVCSAVMCLVLVCVAVENLCWSLTRCAWPDDLWKSLSASTLQIWKKFARPVIQHFLLLREGCLSWKFVKDLMAEWPFPWFRACLTRWWEEVVHLHDAIAI